MPFHVYPDPQTSPRNVAASVTSPLESIDELVGAGAGPFGLDTMFIRVAMVGTGCTPSGAADPTVILKADTGDEVAVPAAPTVVSIFNLPGGSGVEVANATMHLEANDVYRVEIYVFVAGSSWQIRIQNNDGVSAHDYTWVVADADAEASQPWIDVPATLDWDLLGKSLTGQQIPNTLQVVNFGTGDLNITDSPGAIGSSDYEIVSTPSPVPPSHCGNVVIQFNAPTTPGLSTTTYTVGSNDTTAAMHNDSATLTATAGRLEVIMVLDISGSMDFTPDGSGEAVAESDGRWGKLEVAASQFLNLLTAFAGDLGNVGVVLFPDLAVADDPKTGSSTLLQSAIPIPADVSGITTSIEAETAQAGHGWTPIGHGIGTAMGTISSSYGEFAGPPDSDFNERWLVLMSDGAHNAGPPDPPDFFGAASVATSFRGKKIRVIGVSYGDPGAINWPPDHALMQTIVSESDGNYCDAGADDEGLDLLKCFRSAIVAGLTLDPTSDPTGTLTSSVPEARRKVTVLPYDTKVAFVVSWNTFDEKRVSVQILNADCELITPSVAKGDPDIRYVGHPRYAIYTFNRDYLRNASNPTDPRYGEWTLIITGNGLSGTDTEKFEYEVITESRLRMRLEFDRNRYYAGDTIGLSVRLTLDGEPIRDANVTLRLQSPGTFVNNWLADTVVTGTELKRAQKQFGAPDVTPLALKGYAITHIRKLAFDHVKQATTITMTDASGEGVYSASVNQTTVAGSYRFHVTAVGESGDGVSFRREKEAHQFLDVRPHPDFTLVDIVYSQIIKDDRLFQLADVRTWPRDPFGNVKLVDHDLPHQIQLRVAGGDFTGPLVSNLDGSYSRSILYDPQSLPFIGLQVGGQDVFSRRRLAPVVKMSYADRVFAFKLGAEAKKGANRYRDPKAALGDVLRKKREQFVSLGGHGFIVLGVYGKAILADGEEDVTVFVRSGESLHSYSVEALPFAKKRQAKEDVSWIELGRSRGVTQSFSLAKAKIKAAHAIRIVDRSGRTRDSRFKASPAPGVSILGVGFLSTSSKPKLVRESTEWQEMLGSEELPDS